MASIHSLDDEFMVGHIWFIAGMNGMETNMFYRNSKKMFSCDNDALVIQ